MDKEQCCGTCKWNAYDKQFKDFVCVNANSEHCADFITYEHKCEEWEGK